jgi:integrase
MKRLRDAARGEGRNGLRDGLLVLMLFRHGLRVAEAVALTWDEIHFEDGTLFVRRVKNGREAVHFMEGDEIWQLKQLRRERSVSASGMSPFDGASRGSQGPSR